MARFTDREGTDWIVDITVDTIRRIKTALEVNLTEAAGGRLLERLADDPVALVDVLYVICRDQVEERGLTDEDFGRRLGGDSIEAAVDALIQALIDFFPSRRRSHLAAIWHKQQIARAKLDDMVAAKIDGEAFDQALETIIETSSMKMDQEIRRATEREIEMLE